jgi:hypothetical protein
MAQPYGTAGKAQRERLSIFLLPHKYEYSQKESLALQHLDFNGPKSL